MSAENHNLRVNDLTRLLPQTKQLQQDGKRTELLDLWETIRLEVVALKALVTATTDGDDLTLI